MIVNINKVLDELAEYYDSGKLTASEYLAAITAVLKGS